MMSRGAESRDSEIPPTGPRFAILQNFRRDKRKIKLNEPFRSEQRLLE